MKNTVLSLLRQFSVAYRYLRSWLQKRAELKKVQRIAYEAEMVKAWLEASPEERKAMDFGSPCLDDGEALVCYADLTSYELIQFLHAGADPNAVPNPMATIKTTPLQLVDDAERLKILLEFGADPNGVVQYIRRMSNVEKKVMKVGPHYVAYERPKYRDRTPILVGHRTPIFEHLHNLEMLEMLLSYGADPNWDLSPSDDGCSGFVPLAYARTREEVELLVKYGANVNAGGLQTTPLVCAISRCQDDVGYLDVVKALLDAGADVNSKDGDYSSTALLLTTCSGWDKNQIARVEIVRLLIDAGVDVNYKDKKGRTAIVCCFNPYEKVPLEIAVALIDAGVNTDQVMNPENKHAEEVRQLRPDIVEAIRTKEQRLKDKILANIDLPQQEEAPKARRRM